MANKEMIKKVLDHIKAHPEQHDQDCYIQLAQCDTPPYATWSQERYEATDFVEYASSCGASACVAGWAAILSGWKPVSNGSYLSGMVWSHPAKGSEWGADFWGDIDEIGQKELGLTPAQACELFFDTNNKEAVQYLEALLINDDVRLSNLRKESDYCTDPLGMDH